MAAGQGTAPMHVRASPAEENKFDGAAEMSLLRSRHLLCFHLGDDGTFFSPAVFPSTGGLNLFAE
jgi:hypothetical protein